MLKLVTIKNNKNIKQFPLYDLLLKRAKEHPDNLLDIKCICTTINNIAQILTSEEANFHYSNIGALIIHHDTITNNGATLSPIPYFGKVMIGNRGILYTIGNLPIILQQIISNYLEYYA